MFQDESEAETRTGVVGLESSKLELDGLQPYTTYRLTLHTTCRDGKWDTAVRQELVAATAPAPATPRLTHCGPACLGLSWSDPAPPTGNLTGLNGVIF